MKLIILIVILCSYYAEAGSEATESIEPRGKGKYALLINLTALAAAKIGLLKIFLGIAFIVAAMKAMVVMAWALSIAKYAPELWPAYKKTGHTYNFKDHYGAKFEDTIHFAWVALTKLFVLKLIYGGIFFVLIYKAWHFVVWFIHYVKKKEHHHHEYIEYDPHPHFDHGYFEEYYGHGKPGYGKTDAYYPYKRKVYDSDGSYSVKQ